MISDPFPEPPRPRSSSTSSSIRTRTDVSCAIWAGSRPAPSSRMVMIVVRTASRSTCMSEIVDALRPAYRAETAAGGVPVNTR